MALNRKKVSLQSVDLKATKDPDVYEATFLAGGGVYNGTLFPAEEVRENAASMVGQPVNLNHSAKVEDEVGFVEDAWVEGDNLRGAIRLNPDAPKYATAKAFIKNRQRAGKVPEVSVGVFIDVDRPTKAQEKEGIRAIARGLEYDHLALVTRGACGPGDGCGVGLHKEDSHMTKDELKDKMDLEDEVLDADIQDETPEVDANADPAPEAEKDCACSEAEKMAEENADLKVRLEKAEADLAVYVDAEKADLRAEAEELGAEVAEDADLETLRSTVTLARSVAEKQAAKFADKTKAAPAGKVRATPKTKAQAKKNEAAELLKGRVNLATLPDHIKAELGLDN